MEKPVQNDPTLFLTRYWVAFQRQRTNMASWAAKAAAQENFDLQLHPEELKFCAPLHGTKGPGYDQNLKTGTLSEAKEDPMQKLLTIDGQVPKLSN